MFIGNTEPSGLCTAGYFCTERANNSMPTDGTTGNICPAGKYCVEGSITGTGCPKGTFSATEGLTMDTDCDDCTPGYYCGSVGLTVETGTCWAGKYLRHSCKRSTKAHYFLYLKHGLMGIIQIWLKMADKTLTNCC